MQTKMISAGAATAAWMLAASVWAGTTQVPGDYPTIQAAIDASMDGDEIVLADGTYTGPGNQDLSLGGREITIRSANGPVGCTIDVDAGFSSTPAVNLTAIDGPNTRIEGITFTGNFGARGLRWDGATATVEDCVFEDLNSSELYDSGGAVLQTGGDSTFIGCTFRNNTVADCGGAGGAIATSDGSLSVADCDFESNRANGGPCADTGDARGGAIAANGTVVTITDSRFDQNDLDGYSFSLGGAMSLTGCIGSIEGCVFTANTAAGGDPNGTDGKGGAIYLEDSPVSVRDCVFTGNACRGGNAFSEFGADTGTARGGAIYIEGDHVDISRSRFDSNESAASTAGFFGGGAVSVEADASTTVVSCSFVGNVATGPIGGVGGGMLVLGTASFANCLVTDSAAVTGAGLYAAGDVDLTNATVDGNVDASAGPVHTTAAGTMTVRNSIVRTQQAIVFDGAGALDVGYSNVTGGAGGTGNIDLEPDYIDAANGNYRLSGDSPSVDTANDASLPMDVLDVDDDGNTTEPLPTDLDGATRIVGKSVDMGAYENDGCAADIDGNGSVGFSDLTTLLAAWGACPGCPEDLDDDGSVGFSDLTRLLAAWGPCP